MFNTQMLADMRQQNIKEVNADDLVDIRTVSVDTSLPPEPVSYTHLRSYTSEQINNWANERWKVPVNKTFTLAFRVIAEYAGLSLIHIYSYSCCLQHRRSPSRTTSK